MRICFFGTYNSGYTRNTSLRDGLKEIGVDVVEVQKEIPNERMELPEDFTFAKTIKRIWRKVKIYGALMSQYKKVLKCNYVLVLHPGHLDLPFAWILCKMGKKKLIFDTSISPYDTMFVGRDIAKRNSFKAIIVKTVEKLLLRLPDKMFTDTLLMKDFIAKEFKVSRRKIFVVPLGANDRLYKPLYSDSSSMKSESGSSNDGSGQARTVNVLFFGLYNQLHGVEHIMEAIKILKDEKNIRFTMIGDGYLKEGLVKYAKENELSNVKFLGFMPEVELVKNIQKSDIMLGIFSNNPVFERVIANKIFAAVACKKALISGDRKPMHEYFVHKQNIYYCKPENPQDLARAIKEVSGNKNMRTKIADNGYELFQENFTSKKIVKKLIENITY